jgi:hypothetical protein
VRLKAKHEGVYTVRAVCPSRKLALEPALLQVEVTLSNTVTSVELSVRFPIPSPQHHHSFPRLSSA